MLCAALVAAGHTGGMTDTPRRSTGVRWSVRTRILASILLVTGVGMLVSGGTSYLLQRGLTLDRIDERLVSRVESARAVLTTAARSTAAGEPEVAVPTNRTFTNTSTAMRSVLSHVPGNSNESALGVIDGVPAWLPGVPVDFRIEDVPGLVERIVDESNASEVRMGTSLAGGRQIRYIAAPMQMLDDAAPEGEEPQSGIYIAAVDVDAEFADLNSTFSTFALVAGIALFVIGLVGWFVAGRLLRPIRRLRAAASRITAGDLSERIPVNGSDDVSELTVTVNDMLGRLDGAMTTQRQLLDDVRHELKTPITIVRGHLEVLDIANVADVEATRTLAVDELDRMARLVDDIDSLTESQSALVMARVAAGSFTADVFAKASVIGGHDWVLVESADAVVAIDPGRITQAWLQLADNAAKYSPPESTIEMGSTVSGTTVEFWVADNGPGIAPASVERIFERFGRVDSGRGIRGSGLGLPIVKAIALSHGGTVNLSSSSAGSRFAIVVPRLETARTDPTERIPT